MLPSEALTRYYSDASPEQVLVELSNQFDAMVVPSKIHKRQLKIQFQTVDRRKCPLHGDVFVQRCDGNSLVVFRRTKVRMKICECMCWWIGEIISQQLSYFQGDPIEFKRFFKVILGSVNYLE